MLKKAFKKNEKSDISVQIDRIMTCLKDIYSNKSSDEYKCHGDIAKSPQYERIEYSVAQLSTIKSYPDNDAKALKNLFNSLHRPIFGKMVTAYLAKPDDRNIIFTTIFTVGYRLLIGELARIFASTEATERGITYKPDKISRKESVMPLVRLFNDDLEKRIDEMITRAYKEQKMTVQEASILEELGAAANSLVGIIENVFGFLGGIFKSAAALNPVALMSAILSRSYDKKVQKYVEVSALYEATKKQYDEYMKIPAAQRKKRIEHNYVKMMEKYNIKMNNLKANIDHYDLRAKNDAEHKSSKASSSASDNKANTKTDGGPESSSTVDASSSGKKTDNDFDF